MERNAFEKPVTYDEVQALDKRKVFSLVAMLQHSRREVQNIITHPEIFHLFI